MKKRKLGFSSKAGEVIRHDEYLSLVYNDIYKTFFELSGSNKKHRVLELGAGEFTLSDRFWNEVTKSDIQTNPDNKNLLKIDADAIDLPTAQYDLVIAKDALHHFKKPLVSLASIMRLLAPGGMFIVSEPMWSPLGKFIFRFFHPENWDASPVSLNLDSDDPWEGNQALLYLLSSDWKSTMQREIPGIIVSLEVSTYGFSYLLSGGVHSRTPIPSSALKRIYHFEKNRQRLMKFVGLNKIAVFQLTTTSEKV